MQTITKENYLATVEYLNKASDAYYKDSSPIMSDAEFDSLLDALEAFEAENPELISKDSPTQNVGSDITFGFEKVKHDIPMLSIAKVTEFNDLNTWINETNIKTKTKNRYSLETKIDGSSLSLTYKNGKLVRGVTRGRGDFGDLIGENVFAIKNIPHTLPEDKDYEIRGEVIITDSSFEEINKSLVSRGEKTYANSRNLASGSLKLKDVEEVKKRHLTFIAYSVVKGGSTSQKEDLTWLETMGFEVPFNAVFSTFEDIEDWIKDVDSNRKKLPYQIDGVVIKVDDKTLHQALGGTSKTPHFLKAFKFAAETTHAKLEGVTFQVGRTGNVTPLAHFEGVSLGGVVIKKCTLHNFDYINTLGIQVGDVVEIARNGDVIPGVRSLVEKGKNRTPILPPEFCPACETGKVERVNGEVVYKCMNPDCSAKILGKFKHFVSKHSMDMFGLSEKILEQLIDLELVSDFADLYDLTEEMLIAKVPRMGKKKAENFVNAVQTSKNRGLAKLLVGLSIPNCGENTCKNLANEFKSIDAMLEAPFEKYLEIPDVGSTTARSIFDYFASDENIRLIERLKERGIKMTVEETRKTGNSLEGKVFCVTGTLSVPRKQIEQLIEANGGRCASMSKSVNFLIAGEDCGSKLDKAEKLGIPVIDESALMEMIG